MDIEYQVSVLAPFSIKDAQFAEDHKAPRFDLIAVGKDGKVYVIELKKGLNACKGKSGLQDHLACFSHTIRGSKAFVDEIGEILRQKHALGLLPLREIRCSEPTFVFAYAEKDGKTCADFVQEFRADLADVPVWELDREHHFRAFKK